MGFYVFICFIYYFLLFFLANAFSFLVAWAFELADDDEEKREKMQVGDEEMQVTIATNFPCIFQGAAVSGEEEEDAEEIFEDAPVGEWIPSSSLFATSARFLCQSEALGDESDAEVEDDDVECILYTPPPTPSTPEPPKKKRDLRSDPFLYKKKKSFVDRLRNLFCCCRCAKAPDRYYFL